MRFQRRNRGEEKGCPQIESAATARYCNVVQRTVPVPGLKCTGTGKAWVLYPDDGAQHPLASFAHGANTAWNVTAWMPQLLYGLAARGYVVVAPEGIGNAHCLETSADQIQGLDWASSSALLGPHIDSTSGTGYCQPVAALPVRRQPRRDGRC